MSSFANSSKINFHDILIVCCLLFMGGLIIYFNVMGYEILFSDSSNSILGISPFGFLLGFAELAVLVWTSAVISNWPNTSRILKCTMFLLVPAFAFICYSGINSYLTTLSTVEIQKVEELKQKSLNNDGYLDVLTSELNIITQDLNKSRNQNVAISQKISDVNSAINMLSTKASERRQTASNCELVDDCRESVNAFQSQISRLEFELKPLYKSRDRTNDRIYQLENRLDDTSGEVNEIKSNDVSGLNSVANTASSYEMKKDAYANAVVGVTSMFGWEPQKPFNIFVNLISALIYPVYFMLNLYTSLNSATNKKVRDERIGARNEFKKKKREYKSMRNELYEKIKNYLRIRALRKKKEIFYSITRKLEIKRQRKSKRTALYRKLIAYFRVWAHSRKKTNEIQIETIVENQVFIDREVEIERIVEIEVEKTVTVEKIIEVEKIVEKEVVIEVERIVKVPTEVAVYVEKLKRVPEPFFVNDPQIIIHERIIPVPSDLTGKELEELFNAQPRLNETARNTSKESDRTNEKQGNSVRSSSPEESTADTTSEPSIAAGAGT